MAGAGKQYSQEQLNNLNSLRRLNERTTSAFAIAWLTE